MKNLILAFAFVAVLAGCGSAETVEEVVTAPIDTVTVDTVQVDTVAVDSTVVE